MARVPRLRRLLTFAQNLQGATTFAELLDVTRAELSESLGYGHAWLFVAESEEAEEFRLLDASGTMSSAIWNECLVIPYRGDAMLEEVVQGDAPVIVEDARVDPRTNKDLVAALGNRTIINVPLRMLERPLGAFGTGTFGEEGCRPPTPDETDYLIGMASQLSVAVARLRFQEQRAETERQKKELEHRIRQFQKLESLGLMASGIAHDFNNLLTIVLAHASLLRDDVSREHVPADADAIIGAAERARQLTLQLLAMGKQQTLQTRTLDLSRQMRALLSMLRRVLPAAVEVEIDASEPGPLVTGDPSQLDQVMLNLFLNARDAMPNGGRLALSVETIELDAASAEVLHQIEPGRYARVTVADDGLGMPSGVVERVFDPFFTTKTTPGREGTGLGLAVAYGIVRQHGGVIHCESEPSRGTTFQIHLPISKETAPDAVAPPQPPAGGTEQVLVAEDEPALRDSIARVLHEAGYTVVVVADGEAAVETATRRSFDLVILDVEMPRRGGVSAAAAIREARPGSRFLFSSGSTPMSPEFAPHFLTKPYRPDELLRAVREALDAPG